jgi:hypothetical protein
MMRQQKKRESGYRFACRAEKVPQQRVHQHYNETQKQQFVPQAGTGYFAYPGDSPGDRAKNVWVLCKMQTGAGKSLQKIVLLYLSFSKKNFKNKKQEQI